MKRFAILTFLAIGLLSVSAVVAKDREPVSVSIETGNSAGFDQINQQVLVTNYVAEATKEVIRPYVDSFVKPTLDGHKRDVFHPPVNRNQNI